MKIIIAGCGKIGVAITKSMLKEGHDVTVIDSDRDRVNEMSNIFEVMGVSGNAADSDVLAEADVPGTDLFIAVTASDELNMLSCLFARRLGARHTIARVRKTDYNDRSLDFIKQQLELSMTINPEQLAAKELFNLLRLPSAVRVETFSNRNFEMVVLPLKADTPLNGMRLSEMRARYKGRYLICTVQRGDAIFIPDGNFELQSGDQIGLAAAPAEIQKILKQLNLTRKQARSLMILGGSRTAYYLARRLSFAGNYVKIIEQDRARAEEIAELLPSCAVISADGAEQELLLEEGIRSVDAFIALTGMDEENILLAAFASSVNVKKVIAKVNRTELAGLAKSLGLDTIVDPKQSVADRVTQYARALSNSRGSKIETLYNIADGKAEVLEFAAAREFPGTGVPLKNLDLKRNLLVAGIVRNRRTMIPTGDDAIQPADKVIVVTAGRQLNDLSDILK